MRVQLGEAWIARGNLGEGDDSYEHACRALEAAIEADATSVPEGMHEFLEEYKQGRASAEA